MTTLPIDATKLQKFGPCTLIINGGVHTHRQGADFQEFMIAPYGANSFRQALEWG